MALPIGSHAAKVRLVANLVFFFQAVDGIRDRTVTEVQTCALPICHRFLDLENPLVVGVLLPEHFSAARRESDPLAARRQVARDQSFPDQLEDSLGRALLTRSEERRVGKGCEASMPAEHGIDIGAGI